MPTAPQLSLQLRSFAAEDPGTWQPMIDVARAADRAGVDRIVVSDHVVFGEHLEAYADPARGGVEGGRQPTGPDGLWLEPLTVLALLVGLTERVRLGTGVLQAALRRPAVLAKTAATLDVLSQGRLDLGVGVGWQREEYEAAGLDYGRRGALLDHTLEVAQVLWSETRAGYRSEFLDFDAIHLMPKPVQPGGVPVWISGSVNRRSMSRLARFGSGWIPWGPDAADISTGISRMRAAVGALDRDPGDIQVVGTLPVARSGDGSLDVDATMAAVPPLVAAGVTDFRAHLAIPDRLDAATTHLSEVVRRFRETVA